MLHGLIVKVVDIMVRYNLDEDDTIGDLLMAIRKDDKE